MTYYRMRSLSKRATPRTPCDNCGRPFKEHRYVTTDRDGDLHECPKLKVSAKKKPAVQP